MGPGLDQRERHVQWQRVLGRQRLSIAINASFLADTPLASLKPILCLETVALWAFGFSWLTKGEFILQD